MTEEQKQERNTDKKRIAKLEEDTQNLLKLHNQLVSAIRHTFHTIGCSPDILEKHGIKPFDPKTEKLRVNGRA